MQLARALKNASKQVVQKGQTGINAVNLGVDNCGLVSIAVAVKAGTRYEPKGCVAHSLAACLANTNESHTAYLQTQQLERAGGSLTASVTREHIIYTFKSGPKLAQELFSDVVMPGLFCSQDWDNELIEKEWHLKKVNQFLSKKEKLIDGLHAVSFKSGGLQNSVHPDANRLGNGEHHRWESTDNASSYIPQPQHHDTRVKAAEVAAYRDMTFSHDNITVFTNGLGDIETQAVIDSITAYTAPGASREAAPSAFVSGELRLPAAGKPSGYIGFPGAAVGAKNQAAFAALAQLLGGDSFSYSGAGLLAVPTSDPKATLAAMANLDDEAVNVAIELAANEAAIAAGSFEGAVSELLNGGASGATNAGEVKSLAASLAKGKKSLVIQGDLNGVDFLSEL